MGPTQRKDKLFRIYLKYLYFLVRKIVQLIWWKIRIWIKLWKTFIKRNGRIIIHDYQFYREYHVQNYQTKSRQQLNKRGNLQRNQIMWRQSWMVVIHLKTYNKYKKRKRTTIDWENIVQGKGKSDWQFPWVQYLNWVPA